LGKLAYNFRRDDDFVLSNGDQVDVEGAVRGAFASAAVELLHHRKPRVVLKADQGMVAPGAKSGFFHLLFFFQPHVFSLNRRRAQRSSRKLYM